MEDDNEDVRKTNRELTANASSSNGHTASKSRRRVHQENPLAVSTVSKREPISTHASASNNDHGNARQENTSINSITEMKTSGYGKSMRAMAASMVAVVEPTSTALVSFHQTKQGPGAQQQQQENNTEDNSTKMKNHGSDNPKRALAASVVAVVEPTGPSMPPLAAIPLSSKAATTRNDATVQKELPQKHPFLAAGPTSAADDNDDIRSRGRSPTKLKSRSPIMSTNHPPAAGRRISPRPPSNRTLKGHSNHSPRILPQSPSKKSIKGLSNHSPLHKMGGAHSPMAQTNRQKRRASPRRAETTAAEGEGGVTTTTNNQFALQALHNRYASVPAMLPSTHGTHPVGLSSHEARRAAFEAKFREYEQGAAPNNHQNLDADSDDNDHEEGDHDEKGPQGLVFSAECPGAYAGDGQGTNLVRNEDMRYSLLREETEAEESKQMEYDVVIVPSLGGDNHSHYRNDPSAIITTNEPSSTTAGLAKAVPVQDSSLLLDVDVEQISPEQLEEMTEKEKRGFRSALWCAVCATCMGLVVVVGIALMIVFLVDFSGDDDDGYIAPLPPTPAPTAFYFDVPDDTAAAIMESAATPQSQAYRWLRLDPNFDNYPDWRLKQRFALATLYFSTTTTGTTSTGQDGGQEWKKKTSWMTYDNHECDWYFSKQYETASSIVTVESPCREDGVYELLLLPENNLHGTLAPEVFWLESLKIIDLMQNSLEGSLPSHIGRLADLRHLVLDKNFNLTGRIPSELGLLRNISVLAIAWTSLAGSLPSELGLLSSVKDLVFSWNELTGRIPSELGLLREAEALLLSGNNLTHSIPTELAEMSSLRYLGLDSNRLTGGIPSGLGQLNRLYYLALSENQFTGVLIPELFQISSLRELSLFDNHMSGTIPTLIGLWTNVNGFLLNKNNFTGTIPTQVGLLRNMKDLDLQGNNFTGPIPSELGLLTSTTLLWLNQNSFTGTLPSQMGQLSGLYYLDISSNQMTGPIPSEIGTFETLFLLNMSTNALTSTLPSEIGLCQELLKLDLDHNQLNGPLPSELSLLRNLSLFHWSNS